MSSASLFLSTFWSPCIRILILRRQKENTMLGQRLVALEQKLEALQREREHNGSAARETRSAETTHATVSTPAHVSAPSQASGTPENSSDQYDLVDGMGSVALIEGGDEHEYFGKPYPLGHLNNSLASALTACLF